MTTSERFAPLALHLEAVACQRGGRPVFQDLSLSAEPGALVEITGPNGAGKSTLLRLVAGLVQPAAGRVRFTLGGQPLGFDDPEPAQFLHWIGHQDGLKAALSVAEALAFAIALFGGQTAAAGPALAAVGLTRLAGLPVQVLSAGQRRRLALARLIAVKRPLWLLDEPFAAVDGAGRALVQGLIAAHLGEGGSVLAATHDPLLAGARRVALAAS